MPNKSLTGSKGEVAQFLNAEGKTLEQIELTPENLVEMLAIIEDGTISSKIAKKSLSTWLKWWWCA